jgi:cadmium resistance transport/sequestration family protein
MTHLITDFTQGIIAFTATNIDDILILLLFFSQIDQNFRRRHIIIGQYLGFSAIILLSLPGFFGGLFIQKELIGLLGLIPIMIGVRQLFNREEETTEIQAVSADLLDASYSNSRFSFLLSVLHPNTYKVAAITIANGGDNISIYIPLFAGLDFASLGVTLVVFLAMVGVWCGIAYVLSRQRAIATILSRYGQAMVPYVLIALGLLIMYERGTFNLIKSLAGK